MSSESTASKDVNEGRVRNEIVIAEGFVLSPEEETEGEMRIVLDLEKDIGKLAGIEAVGTEGVEESPAGF